jgi:hypothetical protein
MMKKMMKITIGSLSTVFTIDKHRFKYVNPWKPMEKPMEKHVKTVGNGVARRKA